MVKMYKVDKVACLKHVAAEDGINLSYRSKSEEGRRMTAHKRQEYRKRSVPDKESEFGPPDHVENIVSHATAPVTRKRKRNSSHSDSTINVDNSVVQFNHPEIAGKRAKMK